MLIVIRKLQVGNTLLLIQDIISTINIAKVAIDAHLVERNERTTPTSPQIIHRRSRLHLCLTCRLEQPSPHHSVSTHTWTLQAQVEDSTLQNSDKRRTEAPLTICIRRHKNELLWLLLLSEVCRKSGENSICILNNIQNFKYKNCLVAMLLICKHKHWIWTYYLVRY